MEKFINIFYRPKVEGDLWDKPQKKCFDLCASMSNAKTIEEYEEDMKECYQKCRIKPLVPIIPPCCPDYTPL